MTVWRRSEDCRARMHFGGEHLDVSQRLFFRLWRSARTNTRHQLTSMMKKCDVIHTGTNWPFRCLDGGGWRGACKGLIQTILGLCIAIQTKSKQIIWLEVLCNFAALTIKWQMNAFNRATMMAGNYNVNEGGVCLLLTTTLPASLSAAFKTYFHPQEIGASGESRCEDRPSFQKCFLSSVHNTHGYIVHQGTSRFRQQS